MDWFWFPWFPLLCGERRDEPLVQVLTESGSVLFPLLLAVPYVFPGSTVWHPDCKQSTKTEEKLRVRKSFEMGDGRCIGKPRVPSWLILGAGMWVKSLGREFCSL